MANRSRSGISCPFFYSLNMRSYVNNFCILLVF